MSDSPAQALGTWPVVVRDIPVAWGDMDAFGHVNNTVYLRWFETARIAYFETIGLAVSMADSTQGPILARATCDFRLPLEYPDTIDVRTTVSRLGTTSFVMNYEVLSKAHNGAVAAAGEGVIVMYDYEAAAKMPLPADLRARIESLSSCS